MRRSDEEVWGLITKFMVSKTAHKALGGKPDDVPDKILDWILESLAWSLGLDTPTMDNLIRTVDAALAMIPDCETLLAKARQLLQKDTPYEKREEGPKARIP